MACWRLISAACVTESFEAIVATSVVDTGPIARGGHIDSPGDGAHGDFPGRPTARCGQYDRGQSGDTGERNGATAGSPDRQGANDAYPCSALEGNLLVPRRCGGTRVPTVSA